MGNKIINWGGNGPLLHLAHANSYHPAAYKVLIDNLKVHFEVQSILFRPFHPEKDVNDFKNWDVLRDDLLEIAENQNWKKVIGVGHSLGSTVTMMAAIKNPTLFDKIVIIEPPCINQIFFTGLDILPYSLAKHLVPPSKIALNRRHKWASKEEAFNFFRPKKIYSRVDDMSLNDFIESGLELSEDGSYRLVFSKFWESKIYCTIQNPYKMFPKLKMPSLCIRANESDVINEKNWQKWQQIHKNATFLNVPETGHLLPLEKPKVIADAILKFSKT